MCASSLWTAALSNHDWRPTRPRRSEEVDRWSAMSRRRLRTIHPWVRDHTILIYLSLSLLHKTTTWNLRLSVCLFVCLLCSQEHLWLKTEILCVFKSSLQMIIMKMTMMMTMMNPSNDSFLRGLTTESRGRGEQFEWERLIHFLWLFLEGRKRNLLSLSSILLFSFHHTPPPFFTTFHILIGNIPVLDEIRRKRPATDYDKRNLKRYAP